MVIDTGSRTLLLAERLYVPMLHAVMPPAKQEANRVATEGLMAGSGSHLARANSPKYSVIANILWWHHKTSSRTKARKNNTGTSPHQTLNTN